MSVKSIEIEIFFIQNRVIHSVKFIFHYYFPMIRYIYTDTIEITSMDKACELCYVAKKYMLPLVVQRCTEYLWSDLNSKNVCRAFEFAKLFEEPDLAERCLQVRITYDAFKLIFLTKLKHI